MDNTAKDVPTSTEKEAPTGTVKDTPKETLHSHTCTVITPVVIGQQPCQVGDTVTLTLSQARPLQHAGFITLDQAAAACIQQLVKREQALLVAAPILTEVMIEEDTPEPEAEPEPEPEPVATPASAPVRVDADTHYERGD